MNERVDDIQEKLSMATNTLQQAIGGMANQMQAEVDRVSVIFDNVVFKKASLILIMFIVDN